MACLFEEFIPSILQSPASSCSSPIGFCVVHISLCIRISCPRLTICMWYIWSKLWISSAKNETIRIKWNAPHSWTVYFFFACCLSIWLGLKRLHLQSLFYFEYLRITLFVFFCLQYIGILATLCCGYCICCFSDSMNFKWTTEIIFFSLNLIVSFAYCFLSQIQGRCLPSYRMSPLLNINYVLHVCLVN